MTKTQVKKIMESGTGVIGDTENKYVSNGRIMITRDQLDRYAETKGIRFTEAGRKFNMENIIPDYDRMETFKYVLTVHNDDTDMDVCLYRYNDVIIGFDRDMLETLDALTNRYHKSSDFYPDNFVIQGHPLKPLGSFYVNSTIDKSDDINLIMPIGKYMDVLMDKLYELIDAVTGSTSVNSDTEDMTEQYKEAKV